MIFFATPMYGGQCTAGFHRSAMALANELTRQNINYSWSTPYNESLITRARNNIVHEFLQTDHEALMFIDADIEFTPEDVNKLWNLETDVACGAYPMKRKDEKPGVWKNGEIIDLSTLGPDPVSVDYAGTGFFLISRKAIEKMVEVYKGTEYEEEGIKYALFDTSIKDGTYLSEDYTFCERWRNLGGEIILEPSIRLKHWGIKIFGENNA